MAQKQKKPQVDFKGGWLTVTEATAIELKNPDIVKELLPYSNCELREDSEGKPIIVNRTVCLDLPTPKDVAGAQKDIEQFESSLEQTDQEVERIKFILEKLLEEKGSTRKN